jgi:hypothetical protein
MMRILGIALAVALAGAIVPQGAPPAEAAKKAKKAAKNNTAKSGNVRSQDLADWQGNYGAGSNKRKRVKRFRPQ